jgi:NADH-quinone oxidoreductase subunit N
MFVVDNFSVFFKIILLIVAILTVLISIKYLEVEDINFGEYYALVLFAVLGMMIMTASTDLIVIYIGLELMAISSYILAGFIKKDPKSIEAALKYFLMGAFTSGILLYGIALLYGFTGSTNLKEISTYLSTHNLITNPGLIFAMILLIAGFSFKISAVPFHMWAPDVYEGAPTPVAAFLSVGSKAASFAGLLRIFFVALIALKPQWENILWVLAVLTMTLGNVVAVAQTNIKRMLAYSSIAHAGYILIGFVVGTKLGVSSILLYIAIYAFMNIGAFSIIILLCTKGNRGDQIEDYAGLSKTNPYAAITLLIFFVSMAGIPPTAGFIGKFYIFAAAIKENYIWLAVIGVLNSAISVYYYFRVVMLMYMKNPQGEMKFSPSSYLTLALTIMIVATIIIGIYPEPFIEAAKISANSLF